jgi:1,4-alpha-glucan branching enzyme
MFDFFTKKKAVDFKLDAPWAKNVSLAGTFNNWSVDSLKMKKYNGGIWKVSLKLKPGHYEYKFIVDDNWLTDPGNSEVRYNNTGSLNSVIEIRI